MLVAEKKTLDLDMFETISPEELSSKQLEAIKLRAIELWTEDKWLAELVKAYSRVTNSDERKGRYSVVKRIFDNKTCHIGTLNALMLAVNCRFQMVCYSQPVIKDI